MQGLFLGLSNGVTCVAYCTPVLVPYMLGEGKSVAQNFLALLQFLLGRLAGYLAFAFVAWLINLSVLERLGSKGLIIGVLYIIFSCLMMVYAFFRIDMPCAAHSVGYVVRKIRIPLLIPVAAGLLSGIALCPPFLLAMTDAAGKGSLSYSLFFFFMFFIGTSVFFIPIPFVGALRRLTALRIIGKMAAGIVGLYYLYAGIITVIAGVRGI
ncbi:MAG: sulfite exporter TauE/SafE family protein [Syntrophorhabdaceae bacterium]|nr:sulfite exporter TauE/SafE family protein [Syntrophorhabdaceae bacterium]